MNGGAIGDLVNEAARLDDTDPLASWRDEFVIADDDLVYLDGNSLGMLPRRTPAAIADVVEEQWAAGLITSWDAWGRLPEAIGDELAPLIGAGPGEVLVHDSVSVNLYQMVHAALALVPDREVIVVDAGDFPSDRYIAAGIAAATGRRVHTTAASTDWAEVAVAVRSVVDYRTAEIADMAAEEAAARAAGALIIWDLSHAAGVVPVDLGAIGARMAVGCTYKFLNGGPGAPGFSYVSGSLIDRIHQPIHGWWSQAEMFEMGDEYQPRPGIARLMIGSPGIIGLTAVRAGISLTAAAGLEAISAKARLLTAFALDCCDAYGLSSPTPRAPERRGGHVSIAHPEARRINAELIGRRVIADFRQPDLIRLGCSPLTTRYRDVLTGVRTIADLA